MIVNLGRGRGEDDSKFTKLRTSSKRNQNKQRELLNDEGREVLMSGTFGPVFPAYKHAAQAHLVSPFDIPLSHRLFYRHLGINPRSLKFYFSHDMIPGIEPNNDYFEQPPKLVGHQHVNFNSRVYCGQFSEDGSFFYTADQDFTVKLYDTQNATQWREYKSISAKVGNWTITDAALSPDAKMLAFTSICDTVQLASTIPEEDNVHLLEFSSPHSHHRSVGFWSVRFSGDGRELVVGANDNAIYVYDIERKKVLVRMEGHTDDVNAVCFAEPRSTHVLFSGSDDGFVKVWDRRLMRSTPCHRKYSKDTAKDVGVLAGHTEGITYVASALQEGGRYCASNAKDQTLKLWDIRKMCTYSSELEYERRNLSLDNFDYRWSAYDAVPGSRRMKHDCSVTTFTGHSVLRTLIRCHFSPPTTTGRKYVYSGSHDGVVHIWSLDGELVGKLDTRYVMNLK